MPNWLLGSPTTRGWIRRRVMTVWLVHVSPFVGTKNLYEREIAGLLLRWIAEPHPSPFDEEAPCACHPGCRTNWSLLMLKETLSASDVVGEVFRKPNDVCEVIEWGEQVLVVAHSAPSAKNAIGIP